MPPEPLPLLREDSIARDKKHDRTTAPPDACGGGATSSSVAATRWRDQYHSPSPRRPPSGQHRQVSHEEPGGRGLTPSRSEGESSRSYSSRYSRDGFGREGRGYLRRSPFNSGEIPRQRHDFITGSSQRSVAERLTPASSQENRGDKNKNDGGVNDGRGTGAADDKVRDHALSSVRWKPWSRPSGFSSAVKLVRSESDGARTEALLPPGKETPHRSLMMSPSPSDESGAKKKPRLGWGQGLAKYEKGKVEGPEDSSGKSAVPQGGDGSKGTVCDASPTLRGVGCPVSPATPSSITFPSRAFEDKLEFSIANNDVASHVYDSPSCESQKRSMNFSLNVEDVNSKSVSCLNAFLADVLQPEDTCSGDSDFTRKTVLNRLQLLKSDILKVLEKTDGEIDYFENEIKKINSELEKAPEGQVPVVLPAEAVSEKKTCATSYPNGLTSSSAPLLVEKLQEDIGVGKFELEAKKHPFDWKRSISCKSSNSTLAAERSVGSDTVELEAQSLILEANRTEEPGTNVVLHNAHGEGDKSHALSAANNDQSDNMDASSKEGLNGGVDCSFISKLLASNQESSKKASQMIGMGCLEFPAALPLFDRQPSNSPVDSRIKERLAMRKHFLRFKEQVLTLKFSAFHFLWKEDLRLLSIMKRRPKSHKRCELSCRSSQSGSRKHRSSTRLPFSLPGNMTITPSKEFLDRIGQLLSDSEVKVHRSYLKMPALRLDKRDIKTSRFITSNGLVEDAQLIEKERALVNPWTAEEKRIFLDKLGTVGKDFKKVSSFLDHKTTADCIEFYYKNHKSESFEAVKKILKAKKETLPSNSYMVSSGKKWRYESNTASLDMLGVVSALVSHSNRQKPADASLFIGHNMKMHHVHGNHVKASGSAFHDETTAADVLTGFGNSISSEGMGSCITTSVDLGDKMEILQVDRPSFPEVTQTIDEEDTCSDEGCGELDFVDWTDEEKSIFIRALSKHGKDFARISHCLGTRSKEQCKIFFSKARKCLSLDMVYQGQPCNDGQLPLCEANEGRSDTEDAYLVEIDSTIGSMQSCSKVDDITQSIVNAGCQEIPQSVNVPQTDVTTQLGIGEHSHEAVVTKVEKLVSGFTSNCIEAVPVGKPHQLQITSVEVPNDTMQNDDIKGPADAAGLSVNEEVEECNNIPNSLSASAALEKAIKVEPFSGVDSDFVVSGSCVRSDVSDNGCKIKSELKQSGEPVIGYAKRQSSMICTEKNINGLCQLQTGIGAHENTGQQESKVISFPNIVFASQHQNHDQMNLLSHQSNSQPSYWKWKKNYSATVNSFPPSIHLGDRPHLAKQSISGFEECKNKQHQDPLDKDACQQYVLENQSMAQAKQTLQILRGYPLCMLNGISGNVVRFDQKTNSAHSFSKKNGNFEDGFPYFSNWHEEKFKDFRHCDSDRGLQFVRKNNQSSGAQLRACSQVTAEAESGRTGDIKLFGKILSHPSALTKTQENEDKPNYPKPSRTNLKFTNVKMDGAFHPLQAETKGLEELPTRSYGFWDGQSIQTGFSSLPESAIFLSKYPAGISGVTYYPTKDKVAGDSLSGLHHSLSVDGKRQHIFHDVKKMNGIVRVGGGSSLVGGNCTDVTDPVVAIKMHYATQARLFSQEDKSWRGDIGSR